MIGRRELILSGTVGLLGAALPRRALAADDPAGIVTAIYARAARGKGDAGQWKIDDIKGSADGKPWSVRGMLAASLKY